MIKKIMIQFFRSSIFLYALVGVVNTIVGFGTMSLLTFCGLIPEISNAIGTIVGILNSYILNKKLTFKSQNSHKQDFIRFSIAMGIAYLANLIVLIIAHRFFGINEYISFILSSITYTGVGYTISRFWAFAQNPKK